MWVNVESPLSQFSIKVHTLSELYLSQFSRGNLPDLKNYLLIGIFTHLNFITQSFNI